MAAAPTGSSLSEIAATLASSRISVVSSCVPVPLTAPLRKPKSLLSATSVSSLVMRDSRASAPHDHTSAAVVSSANSQRAVVVTALTQSPGHVADAVEGCLLPTHSGQHRNERGVAAVAPHNTTHLVACCISPRWLSFLLCRGCHGRPRSRRGLDDVDHASVDVFQQCRLRVRATARRRHHVRSTHTRLHTLH